MELTTTREGGRLTMAVRGSINTVTAGEFERQVLAELSGDGGAQELTLDFAGVDYVSSAGLRALLKIDQDKPAEMAMRLVGVNGEVREVFEMTGFDQLLTIES